MSIIIAHILLLIISLIIIMFSKQISLYLKITDTPNERKSHSIPTPQTGGIIISFYSFFLLMIANYNYSIPLKIILIWSFIIIAFYLIGFIDDKYNLNAKTKTVLVLTILFAILPLDDSLIIESIRLNFLDKPIVLNKASIFLTVLLFYFFYNVFNFSDGLNGISATLSIFWLGYLVINNFSYFNIIHPLVAGIIIFAIFNISGLVFLGNSGSNLLSAIIFLFFQRAYNLNEMSFDKLILLFFLPSIDTIRVTLQRILNGKSPFIPDKNHFHHYLNMKIDKKYVFIFYLILTSLPIVFNYYDCNFFINLFINFIIYFGIINFCKK